MIRYIFLLAVLAITGCTSLPKGNRLPLNCKSSSAEGKAFYNAHAIRKEGNTWWVGEIPGDQALAKTEAAYWYVGGKGLRRNKWPVALEAPALLLCLVGVGYSLDQMGMKRDQPAPMLSAYAVTFSLSSLMLGWDIYDRFRSDESYIEDYNEFLSARVENCLESCGNPYCRE